VDFKADEFISDADSVLELGHLDDEAVDKGQQCNLVLETVGVRELVDDNFEAVSFILVILKVKITQPVKTIMQ